MEYKVGDDIFFKLSALQEHCNGIILSGKHKIGYKVIAVTDGAYFIDYGKIDVNTNPESTNDIWFDCNMFLTKVELRSLKLNKILERLK